MTIPISFLVQTVNYLHIGRNNLPLVFKRVPIRGNHLRYHVLYTTYHSLTI